MTDHTESIRALNAHPTVVRDPDSHGQAALLLVESLIHGLIAQETVSLDQAIEIIEVAAEIKVEVAEAAGERSSSMIASLALLEAMAASLRRDRGG